MNGTDTSALVTLDRVTKTYSPDPREGRMVLDGIDFQLDEREIVALLGQSGCGKSTLLRIIAGLQPPTGGSVLYRGRPVSGPTQGIAMVFQSFALFPWLSVLENVELGLEAQGIRRTDRRERALQAIDMIGLDGFESAYPKELSGGMRQRVGFARALVVSPDVLLLDEPFSALDVLTAETLRGDLLELWHERRISTSGIVFVSHNIAEAVAVADRILVLSSHPGRIRAEVPVSLEHPRDSESGAFRELVDEIYRLLTESLGRPTTAAAAGAKREQIQIGVGHRLPAVSIQQLTGLLDALASPPYNGRADLPALAESENIDMDGLLRLIEALHLLGFGQIEAGDVTLSRSGRAFVEADILGRKKIFAEHLLHHIPLAGHIRRVLDERPSHRAPEERFLNELQDYLPEDEAEQVLETMINWARYAELFAYNYDSGVLSLDNP